VSMDVVKGWMVGCGIEEVVAEFCGESVMQRFVAAAFRSLRACAAGETLFKSACSMAADTCSSLDRVLEQVQTGDVDQYPSTQTLSRRPGT